MVAEAKAEAKRHQAEVARRDTLLQASKADLVKVSLAIPLANFPQTRLHHDTWGMHHSPDEQWKLHHYNAELELLYSVKLV